ncbi:unnamed protein product [Ectocarpus sp. CCAP 1310/34]|nr:unnamed protein product [Ectocarpus sp. CCAP 1310/34]
MGLLDEDDGVDADDEMHMTWRCGCTFVEF